MPVIYYLRSGGHLECTQYVRLARWASAGGRSEGAALRFLLRRESSMMQFLVGFSPPCSAVRPRAPDMTTAGATGGTGVSILDRTHQ